MMHALNHEIELYEAAIISKENKRIASLFITSLILIISLIIAFLYPSILKYMIPAIIILVFIIVLLIKKYKTKNMLRDQNNYQVFIEIFYKAMLQSHPIFETQSFHLRAPYHINVSPRVMTDMLDDQRTYIHTASLNNEEITIDLIEMSSKNNQHLKKCIVTMPFMYNDSFECRSYKKPTLKYAKHQRLRGYDIFYNHSSSKKPYITWYESLRVHPNIDQLDITYRDQQLVIAFKLATSFRNLHATTNKKNLMYHQNYLNKTFDCIHHLMQTLKEIQSENRSRS